MEYASIEREIHIDAPPEVVSEVISRPEHIREWWYAESDVPPTPGATGGPGAATPRLNARFAVEKNGTS